MTLLTADDVLNKKFQATKFREGYEQDEVDEFLDEVVEAMRQLEAENADLKAKLEAANRRIAQLSEGAAIPSAPASPVSPVQAEPALSMPAVSAGDTGAQGPAAASGMLELAQRLHDEHVASATAPSPSWRRSAPPSSRRLTSCGVSSPITALASRATCRTCWPTSRTAARAPSPACDPAGVVILQAVIASRSIPASTFGTGQRSLITTVPIRSGWFRSSSHQ